MNFFIKNYPTTFTWNLKAGQYSYDSILLDEPQDIIQEDSRAHQSLYNLLSGDYGGLKVKIRVEPSGICKIVGLENELPISGHVRR